MRLAVSHMQLVINTSAQHPLSQTFYTLLYLAPNKEEVCPSSSQPASFSAGFYSRSKPRDHLPVYMQMAAHALLQSWFTLFRVLEETQTMVVKNRLVLQQRAVDVDTMLSLGIPLDSLGIPLDSLGIPLDSDSMTAMSNRV